MYCFEKDTTEVSSLAFTESFWFHLFVPLVCYYFHLLCLLSTSSHSEFLLPVQLLPLKILKRLLVLMVSASPPLATLCGQLLPLVRCPYLSHELAAIPHLATFCDWLQPLILLLSWFSAASDLCDWLRPLSSFLLWVPAAASPADVCCP